MKKKTKPFFFKKKTQKNEHLEKKNLWQKKRKIMFQKKIIRFIMRKNFGKRIKLHWKKDLKKHFKKENWFLIEKLFFDKSFQKNFLENENYIFVTNHTLFFQKNTPICFYISVFLFEKKSSTWNKPFSWKENYQKNTFFQKNVWKKTFDKKTFLQKKTFEK